MIRNFSQQIDLHSVNFKLDSESALNGLYMLCYPRLDEKILLERVEELRLLGVEKLLFEGKVRIGNVAVLGKGNVGIVIKALMKGKVVALKIRRTDADRINMRQEAKLLRLANTVSVGPRFIDATDNIIAMEFIDGISITEWFAHESNLKSVIKEILEQCFRLDMIALDHGELSNMDKHILIVNNLVTIIDFESASLNRRSANVTSAIQYMLIGGPQAEKVRSSICVSKDLVIRYVREYKRNPSRKSFDEMLDALHL